MTDERRPILPPPLPELIYWDPARPLFADVNRFHPLLSAGLYASESKCGLIGIKISQNGLPAENAHHMLRSAEVAGLMVVGYQFGPNNPDQFLALFPPAPGRIPCLDFEGDFAVGKLGIAAAEAFVCAVQSAYGRWPWFYAGASWRIAGEPENTAMAQCPWWGPQYGPHLRLRRGMGSPVAWQYTDGVACTDGAPRRHAGVLGACDMSALLAPMPDLREMAGLSALPPVDMV